MTTTNQIFGHFLTSFGYTPNPGQESALKSLGGFVSPDNQSTCFILTGPAGSGKTSLLLSLISWFNKQEIDFYLAAPTGRAAQIAGKKTQTYANTLHSLLFKVHVQEEPLQISFIPRINEKHDDIRFFLVDEASMISDDTSHTGMYVQDKSMLGQIFRYARQGNVGNKIIFIGDQYQLPPVNASISPALSSGYLSEKYKVSPASYSLETVERTTNNSYILGNAQIILSAINSDTENGSLKYNHTGSFSGGIKQYLNDFSLDPFDQAVMIALANSQVNALNTWARNFRYNYKNKFVVMPEESMICNNNIEIDDHILFKGNHFMVNKTWKPEEFAGLHFINAEIVFDNLYNERVSANTKIMIESVTSKDGTLAFEQEKALIHEAYKRNKRFRDSKRPSDDAFVNAIRARYGYALTCHKAQGGEWNHVYLHPGYRKEDKRWLYTAVTRAVSELYSWSA
ncbi:MAG: AAA family ATPase [Bacteroidales bacterium]|nr:AAA family ATPase [Bacteroidales bacterium]